MSLSSEPFYITTAIDYVNAEPHLGHAYEKIATDVVARFYRLMGRPVFFLTGSDEHGTKIEKTAAKRGLTPKQHTDEMVESFKAAWDYLNLSYDRFIRTTDPEHYAVVAQLWRKLAAKGDIYKKRYQGLYCAGCEKFVNERDLDEAGNCPHHQAPPEVVEEENYFFRLTRYKQALQALVKGESFVPPDGTEAIQIKDFVKPEFRALETLGMIDDLEDISVSRNKSAVSWGIPVPDDEEQVIYVWIDALSNYITGIGYLQETEQQKHLFEKFWPANIHMVGKDILRFHAIYWPAMLMAASVAPPKQVFAHGFININDAKISKSVGNVVSPFTLRDRFDLPNSDPIRYYLMTVATMGQDGSFTEDDFKLRVNADLSNNLGNLLNRTLSMVGKYFDGVVPSIGGNTCADHDDSQTRRGIPEAFSESIHVDHEDLNTRRGVPCGLPSTDAETGASSSTKKEGGSPQGTPLQNSIGDRKKHFDEIQAAYEALDFPKAAALSLELVDVANRAINDKEPWTLFKEGRLDELATLMVDVLETLRQVAILLSPMIPTMSNGIWSQLGYTTPLIGSSLGRGVPCGLPSTYAETGVSSSTEKEGGSPQGTPLQDVLDRSAHMPNFLWTALWEEQIPAGQKLNPQGPVLPRLDSELAGADKQKKVSGAQK